MSDNKPKIGVVGAGHLGRHHIKHLSQHSGVEFVGVFDVNKESLRNSPKENVPIAAKRGPQRPPKTR